MRRVAVVPALLAVLVGATPAHAWTRPVDGPVLKPFSLGEDAYAAGYHRGVDLAAPAGSPIRAPASGAVTFAGVVPEGGRTLTITTADGYAVTLVHLGSIAVTRGASVAEGSIVAAIGPSGVAEHAEPYVHFGVRVASEPEGYIDPMSLVGSEGAVPAPPGEPEEAAPPQEPSDPGASGETPAAAETPAEPPSASADAPAPTTRRERRAPATRVAPARTKLVAAQQPNRRSVRV
ncbi:MAG: peptidoglycan DD-metalloendopeptidase family protein, partial [Actinobacteria bacterium]|nr:peptidoglycan DD-metalloendopeptidase family protein [Actinomycetota bacterium]